MCGLYGIAGYGILQADLDVYRDLGHISLARGTDGSGYYEFNSKNKAEKLFKDRADFEWLRYQHEDKIDAVRNSKLRMLDNLQADVIMGHNRKATFGLINDFNAQPFVNSTFAIAHNGSFRNNKYYDQEKLKSDSSLMVEDMEARGIIPVLNDIKGDGAYSLTILNKKNRKLYFARNWERPLYFAINQERSVMYWASEELMLQWALGRNGIKYQMEGVNSIFQLRDGYVYEVSVPSIKPKTLIFMNVHTIYTFSSESKKFVYTDNEPSKEEKKNDVPVEKEIKKENSVVLLNPPTKSYVVNKNKTTSVLCGCCGKSISAYEQYGIRNNEVDGFYSKDTNRYYCSCVGKGAEKKSVNDNSLH